MNLEVVLARHGVEETDEELIAQIPWLVENMERTAYALVRSGHQDAGHAFFLAAAAAEKITHPNNFSH